MKLNYVKTQKTIKKKPKKEIKNTKNNILFKQWKHIFIVLKKMVFENT